MANVPNRLTSRLAAAKSIDEVVSLVKRHENILDAAATTAAVHRLASLSRHATSSKPFPPQLGGALHRHIPNLTPMQLSKQAWALGRLGGQAMKQQEHSLLQHQGTDARRSNRCTTLARGLVARIATCVSKEVYNHTHPDFPAVVSSVAWASATLRMAECTGFPIRASHVAAALLDMSPQDVANCVWAAAILQRSECLAAPIRFVSGSVRWSVRDAATALWAYAKSQVNPGRAYVLALVDHAVHGADCANGQDVSNTLWAMATFNGVPVQQADMQSIANASVRAHGPTFSPLELANSVWALATMGVHHETFFSKAAKHLVLSAAIQQLLSQDRGSELIANAVWAFSLAQRLLRRGFAISTRDDVNKSDRALMVALRQAMLDYGATRDERNSTTAISLSKAAAAVSPLSGQDPASPRLVHQNGGVSVIYKPPDWEVDGRSSHDLDNLRMSTFVQSALPSACTASDIAIGYGFLHRLDTPSSGLLLHAETYEAFMFLRWQQDSFRIDREYLVLVHGDVAHQLDLRFPLTLQGENSKVSANGRMACTLAHPVVSLVDATGGSHPFTLLVVQIVTGRKHQIRVHLSHAGHPVVCDWRYGRANLAEDVTWCSQNFLHR